MCIFRRDGGQWFEQKRAIVAAGLLPARVFTIQIDRRDGSLFLEGVDNFVLPPKLYGKVPALAERILSTYIQRSNNTGVLLHGDSGSGKSLLAKQVCVNAMKQLDAPVILVTFPITGDEFSTMLQNINQPCVVFFDEYEKVYEKTEHQNMLLTLLDGVFNTNKLMLFTCNDKYGVNKFMLNRPGRIYYALEFAGLDDAAILEYCNEHRIRAEHTNEILNISKMFRGFSFDMLKAVVEEVLRYGESPVDCLEMLNVKPDMRGESRFVITLKHKGEALDTESYSPEEYHGSPLLRNSINIRHYGPFKDVIDEGENVEVKIDTAEHLKHCDIRAGHFVYVNGDYTVDFKRVEEKAFSYRSFMGY
jgi:hypothetical protein